MQMSLIQYSITYTQYFNTFTGCRYLSLEMATLNGRLSLKYTSEDGVPFSKKSQLRVLDLSNVDASVHTIEELLSSCYYLEKLSMNGLKLTLDMIKSICIQNGKTLEVLTFTACPNLDYEMIYLIVKKCSNLIEVSLAETNLPDYFINFFVNTITPNIEKLNFNSLFHLRDEHVKVLVNRCNKLSVLNLGVSCISNNSIDIIITKLKNSLEELCVYLCYVDCAKLLELRLMPKFRTLIYENMSYENLEDLDNLKKQLPHQLKKYKQNLCSSYDKIWNIKAKQIDLFQDSGRTYMGLPD